MLNIGCHLSASKGYEAMAKTALSIGANTFQFFTRNPRGFKAKDIDRQDIKVFLKTAKEYNFTSSPSDLISWAIKRDKTNSFPGGFSEL